MAIHNGFEISRSLALFMSRIMNDCWVSRQRFFDDCLSFHPMLCGLRNASPIAIARFGRLKSGNIAFFSLSGLLSDQIGQIVIVELLPRGIGYLARHPAPVSASQCHAR